MTQTATFGRRGIVAPPAAPPQRWGAPPRTAPQRSASSPTASMSAASPRPVVDDGERTILGYFGWLLFSFDGRLDRRTYRYARMLLNLAYAIALYSYSSHLMLLLANPGMATGLSLAWLAGSGLMIWTTLAMQVKRRHDRDKGWPWLFVGFIPILGPIWVLVETCWLEGTPGFNRFDQASKVAAATFA